MLTRFRMWLGCQFFRPLVPRRRDWDEDSVVDGVVDDVVVLVGCCSVVMVVIVCVEVGVVGLISWLFDVDWVGGEEDGILIG